MTENPKHTPLPWRINRIALTCIESEKGRVTASCGGHQEHPGDSTPENQANTRFIIQAVNNHDALVVACERAIVVAKRMEISKFAKITSLEYRKETIKYFKQILAKARKEINCD